MADKPYINLDDDLIDDYKGPSSMNPPTPPQSIQNQNSSSSSYVPAPVKNDSRQSTKENASDLSVALEQEMQDIEKQMFAVAVEGFNRKRDQAHQDIDKLYDEMISVAQEKLRGITIAIAEQVGE